MENGYCYRRPIIEKAGSLSMLASARKFVFTSELAGPVLVSLLASKVREPAS